ncbi:hypothetical protein [Saccharothrix coeruleofusca]|uniref:Uncharacterized protein n=1 Tax=Saccharothrix coeruleofusca TaxID=33919 RepID=A0A918AGR9_9PSEU|nr:hypothetical protein [Saccharothrix coeruleofusca]GGP39636.1 hypothetical protein GCM10010185_09000 [Saccharothrix coeruleofusca]
MATRYWVEVGCEVRPQTSELEEHVLAVMDALLDDPGAIDPDVTAELSTNTVRIALAVDARTDRDALDRALVITRSALRKPSDQEASNGGLVVLDGFDARVRPAEALGSR